jgi:hypothetical protein
VHRYGRLRPMYRGGSGVEGGGGEEEDPGHEGDSCAPVWPPKTRFLVRLLYRYAGILSAYGLALADVVEEAQEPVACIYGSDTHPDLKARLDALAGKARQRLEVCNVAQVSGCRRAGLYLSLIEEVSCVCVLWQRTRCRLCLNCVLLFPYCAAL